MASPQHRISSHGYCNCRSRHRCTLRTLHIDLPPVGGSSAVWNLGQGCRWRRLCYPRSARTPIRASRQDALWLGVHEAWCARVHGAGCSLFAGAAQNLARLKQEVGGVQTARGYEIAGPILKYVQGGVRVLGLNEGDPLGRYELDLFIDGRLAKTVRYGVVSKLTDTEGSNATRDA